MVIIDYLRVLERAFRLGNTHFNRDSIRFKNMRHGSKKMVYEVHGNYVEGLEKHAGKIVEYFGNDLNGL